MKHLLVALLIGSGAFLAGKQYTVSHTKDEWVQYVQSHADVQRRIHKTDMPVRDADFCDSVLQADYMDVNRQVGAQIQADTTKTKKP